MYLYAKFLVIMCTHCRVNEQKLHADQLTAAKQYALPFTKGGGPRLLLAEISSSGYVQVSEVVVSSAFEAHGFETESHQFQEINGPWM